MKSMTGKELAKILEKHEWILIGIQGGHDIYGKSSMIVKISVPIHGNKYLKIGLLRHLLK